MALAKTLIDIGFEHKHVLLIMDEPTNHLDVEMVEWLEHYLNKENVTLLLVTHDGISWMQYAKRSGKCLQNPVETELVFMFIKAIMKIILKRRHPGWKVKRPVSIRRKILIGRNWNGCENSQKQERQKAKAGRIIFMKIEKKAKQRMEDAQMELQTKMSRLGGKIAELKKVNKKYGDKVICKGFDYTFKKGERVGVIGKNGVGKSTFINIVQGLEQPDSGKVNIGDTVIFGNYSQQGLQVKEDMRVIEFVKNIAENFPLASGGSLSAAQFLNLFLFPPDQQYTYISSLSGGEKRRLHLLSILFRNPNFLVLDEPTNDLDLPTLGVLENFLSEFAGMHANCFT